MSRAVRMLTLVSLVAAIAAVSQSALARSLPGAPNSPACLRGSWVATTAESERVLKSLVPGPYEFRSKLYMIFQDGAFQYGTTKFVLQSSIGGITTTAVGRFFSLQPYTATRGAIRLGPGESTVEFTRLTAGGRSATPPPPKTTRLPGGGPTPFQCRGGQLKYKLPGLSSLGWITLHRGRVASG